MMTSQFSDLLKLNGPDNHQPNQHPIKIYQVYPHAKLLFIPTLNPNSEQ